MDLRVEVIGWIGDVLFIVSYFLVSTGRLNGEGKPFNFMNLTGAFCYGTYALLRSTPPVFILELFWGSIALAAIYKAYRSKAN